MGSYNLLEMNSFRGNERTDARGTSERTHSNDGFNLGLTSETVRVVLNPLPIDIARFSGIEIGGGGGVVDQIGPDRWPYFD